VYVLGFGDAKDDSWMTPVLSRAFEESSELWLEVGRGSEAGSDDAARQRAAEREKELGTEKPGRSLFDDLDPAVRDRTLAAMDRLGIKKEAMETQRPWRAYYTLNGAYWSHARKEPFEWVYADQVLRDLATRKGKPIRYEMPTSESFARFMAAMPDAAQS